jgi:hypothetical protein
MLSGHSEVSPLVTMLCQLQLCTVSGKSYVVATAYAHFLFSLDHR